MVDRLAQVHHDSVTYEDEAETATIAAEEAPSPDKERETFAPLSRYEVENRNDYEMRLDARRMSGRIAISLVVAIFAYLGLLLGGNLVIGPTRGPNSISSSSKDGQPLQLSARDAVRGILTSDRKAAPKYAPYDSGAAAVGATASIALFFGSEHARLAAFHPSLRAADAKAYDSHGPPVAAA